MKYSRDMHVLFFRTGTLSPIRSLSGAYLHTTAYFYGGHLRNQATVGGKKSSLLHFLISCLISEHRDRGPF
jgi:hypothetical protein